MKLCLRSCPFDFAWSVKIVGVWCSWIFERLVKLRGTSVFSRLLWQLETSMYMAKIVSSIFLQHSHVLYLLILLPLGWQSEVTHSNTSFSEDLLGACCQNKFLWSMNDSIFLYICINKPLYLICLSEYTQLTTEPFYMLCIKNPL